TSFHSVCSALGSHLGIDPEHFRATQHLGKDWGLDQLDLNVIALQLEQLEGLELSNAELCCVKTVGQLVNLLRQRKQSLDLETWMNHLDAALREDRRMRERRKSVRHLRKNESGWEQPPRRA
ncbi:MAG TPA: acyl carrier protein, partial [Polyangiales bacterium]|nr:acyl carrier protein [Polyangiales bacterium]